MKPGKVDTGGAIGWADMISRYQNFLLVLQPLLLPGVNEHPDSVPLSPKQTVRLLSELQIALYCVATEWLAAVVGEMDDER